MIGKQRQTKAKFHSGHESLSIGLGSPTSKVDLGVMPFKICTVHNITPDIQILYACMICTPKNVTLDVGQISKIFKYSRYVEIRT